MGFTRPDSRWATPLLVSMLPWLPLLALACPPEFWSADTFAIDADRRGGLEEAMLAWVAGPSA